MTWCDGRRDLPFVTVIIRAATRPPLRLLTVGEIMVYEATNLPFPPPPSPPQSPVLPLAPPPPMTPGAAILPVAPFHHVLHGLLMTVAFGFLFPSAAVMPRFWRRAFLKADSACSSGDE